MVRKVQIGIFDDSFPVQTLAGRLNIFLRVRIRSLMPTVDNIFAPCAEGCLRVLLAPCTRLREQFLHAVETDRVTLPIVWVGLHVGEFYCLDLLILCFFDCFS